MVNKFGLTDLVSLCCQRNFTHAASNTMFAIGYCTFGESDWFLDQRKCVKYPWSYHDTLF